ncbi:MAG: hypothetical protein V3T31_10060, partial [candidate division Zixibacteria bacterium]
GNHDAALDDLNRASALDSTSQIIKFNLALNHIYRSQPGEAQVILEDILANQQDNSAMLESRLTLASLLFRSGQKEDLKRAKELCRQSVNVTATTIRSGSATSSVYLWAGIAQFGVGDLGAAQGMLETALFMENRAFYTGMANLWMGKLFDARGNHERATDHYGLVISSASAAYHQTEARFLIDNPFGS